MKKIIISIIATFSIIPTLRVFADESTVESAEPPLFISAFNAGYKDSVSAQNYDFIELSRNGDEPLTLSNVRIVYNNSSDNEAGEIVFDDSLVLNDSKIVFGFIKSPQNIDWGDSIYVYNFSSSGMASTAGRIRLYIGDEQIDEVCWGKLTCVHENPKFATSEDENYSYARDSFSEQFIAQKYYPDIKDVVTTTSEPADDNLRSCELIITEIYSYYVDAPSEQFVEVYNPTDINQELSNCILQYKNKTYIIEDIIPSNSYYIIQNAGFTLTKDPTTYNTISFGETDYLIPHGQKKDMSYALFNYGTVEEKWLQTYLITPGLENEYQEFRTCEEGKVINPETGNCIKEEVAEEIVCPEGKYLNLLTGRCKNIEAASTTTTCKDGYYLNPLTGRCKKQETSALVKECAEGYERNPETNRCRKIRDNNGTEYPVADISEDNYQNPKIFIATGIILLLAVLGLSYVIFQYRKEIKQGILKICRRGES